MKRNFTIFLLFTIYSVGYGQQEKGKKAIYDDWPTTVPSNAERQPPSSWDVSINFVPIGTTWNHRIITYFFQNGTTDIAANDERQAIRDGFSFWAAETDLYFLEVCNAANADIVFLWGVENHGDGAPFDGEDGVLAHALGGPPPNIFGDQAGDIHFEDDETWTLNTRSIDTQPIDLVTVAAHEIGHSLGLDHTSVSGSLMLNNYTGSHRFLGTDDRAGIRSLYGQPGTSDIISGPSLICTSGSQFTLNESPAGSTVTWTATPSNLFAVSAGSGATPTIAASTNGIGLGTITFNVSSGCGTAQVQKTVWVGKASVDIVGPYDIAFNTSENYYAQGGYPYQAQMGLMGITNFSWSLQPSGYEWIGGQGSSGISMSVSSPGDYSLQLDVTNPCGSLATEFPVWVYGPGSMFTVYPNPASDVLTISKKSTLSSKQTDSTPFEISLYDSRGQQLAGPVSGSDAVELDVSHLKNGFYFVHILYQGKLVKNQIRVER